MSANNGIAADNNVLHSIAGYREALANKERLEATGTDFQEQRGLVRRTVDGIHPKRLRLRVAEIQVDTRTTKTLRMVAADGRRLPPFQAGQYVNLFVELHGVATARPYAISSSPRQLEYYDLTVKRAEHGFVSPHLLDEVMVGQQFQSSGPMGTFHHNPLFHGDDLIFLAGGSGIAPARSMLYNLLENSAPRRLHIIYSNSYADDVIFADELRALAAAQPNFQLTEFFTRPDPDYVGERGRLTLNRLRELAPNFARNTFYICGPTPFNEHCVGLLKELNVKSRQILLEGNGPPRRPEQLPDWPPEISADKEIQVSVSGGGSFRARAGEPLLNSLERNGYATDNGCRSGDCSLCRVKLRAGQVYNPPEALLRKSDRKFGWIHSCVAFPTSDIEVQL